MNTQADIESAVQQWEAHELAETLGRTAALANALWDQWERNGVLAEEGTQWAIDSIRDAHDDLCVAMSNLIEEWS